MSYCEDKMDSIATAKRTHSVTKGQEMKAKRRKTDKGMDNCDKSFEVSIFNILILAKMIIMKKISDMLIYAVCQGCKRLILDNVLGIDICKNDYLNVINIVLAYLYIVLGIDT